MGPTISRCRYFLHTLPSDSWEEDEKYAYDAEKSSHLMAFNGWVMNDDPLKNFALYPSQVTSPSVAALLLCILNVASVSLGKVQIVRLCGSVFGENFPFCLILLFKIMSDSVTGLFEARVGLLGRLREAELRKYARGLSIFVGSDEGI